MRLYAACGHAAELPAAHDHCRRPRSKTKRRERPVLRGLDGLGGVVGDNQKHIEELAAADVPGFKCFLIHPGIDGFTMVTEPELRAALPHVARTGLPLLVHAELPAPVDAATHRLTGADWSKYSTYLQSRPDEAELSAIRLMLSLCREFPIRLHIVPLATT